MKKTTIGTRMLFLVLSATFMFSTSNAWAWGSSRSYSSSYTSSSSGSSWGTSGTSRDGSTSWSSWSYSDNGSATSETLCRKCHGDLKRFPGLKYENPDKHHLLINKVMPSNSIAPFVNRHRKLTHHRRPKLTHLSG